MKTPGCCFFLILIAFIPSGSAQNHQKSSGQRVMTGSAAKGASSAGMQVVPDLARRLAQFRRVPMPFHSSGLTAREIKLVDKLVDACRYLEEIYWRQIDPDGLALYQSLAGR